MLFCIGCITEKKEVTKRHVATDATNGSMANNLKLYTPPRDKTQSTERYSGLYVIHIKSI
jgi:hypothetical protein